MWGRRRLRALLVGVAVAGTTALAGCGSTVEGTATAADGGAGTTSTPGSGAAPPEGRPASGAATDCASLSAVVTPLVPGVSETAQDVPAGPGAAMCVWTGSRGAAVSANVTAKDVDPEIIEIIREDDSAVDDDRVAALGAVALSTVGIGLQTPSHLISVVVAGQDDRPGLDLDVAVAIAEALQG